MLERFCPAMNPFRPASQGPVLVTQGVKDPLNDAEGRAQLFGMIGSQVDVVRLDGGHWWVSTGRIVCLPPNPVQSLRLSYK